MINVNHPDLTISLKEMCLGGANELFLLIDKNRAYFKKYLGWLDKTTSIEDAKNFILFCQQGNKNRTSMTFGVYNDRKLIGIVGFHEIDVVNQTSSIGYWLDESSQGNGIMTSAVSALIDYAIEEFALEQITIRVAVNNLRSQKIPKKLGFSVYEAKKNGEVINGVGVDQFVFKITKEQWKSQRQRNQALTDYHKFLL